MQVRILVPILELGPIQWTRGQIAELPEQLAQHYIASKEAEEVPSAEQATMPKPENAMAVPKYSGKPKPPAKPARRR